MTCKDCPKCTIVEYREFDTERYCCGVNGVGHNFPVMNCSLIEDKTVQIFNELRDYIDNATQEELQSLLEQARKLKGGI